MPEFVTGHGFNHAANNVFDDLQLGKCSHRTEPRFCFVTGTDCALPHNIFDDSLKGKCSHRTELRFCFVTGHGFGRAATEL
jgi:hypothetical protein